MKDGHARHCTEEQSAFIKKLIGEGKHLSRENDPNALKWKSKPEERCGRKHNTTI